MSDVDIFASPGKTAKGFESPLETVRPGFREESGPNPGQEVVGPAFFDLVREVKLAQQVGEQLLRDAKSLMDKRSVISLETGQTDGSGNIDLPLYVCPAGFEFVITRLSVEAIGFTPAVPFASATGWIAIIRGQAFGVGSIVDFLPNPPLANAPILPAQFVDGPNNAAVFRSGERVSLHIANGPVNTDIYARFQGFTQSV